MTNRNNTAKTVEVAILISDLEKVREFTKIFRKMGVVPYFYESLKEFWHGTLSAIPALCIVDVRNMSDGELILKHHPYIKNAQLPVAFYYSEAAGPLVNSTYEFEHLGLINESLAYEGQLKSILKRLNKITRLEEKRHALLYSNKKLERQLSALMTGIEEKKEVSYYMSKLTDLCDQLERERTASDFLAAITNVFERFVEVAEFSYLELGHEGHKLISPPSTSLKYRKIPSIWLGQKSSDGIEPFAQNMANQVGVDLMGVELMALMIRGRSDLPEKMIFLNINDEEFLNKFDWNLFEVYLSGLYSHFCLKNEQTVDEREMVISTWDLLEVLDQCSFKGRALKVDSDLTLIDIDFSELVDFIGSKSSIRFYWKNFYHDFINKFASLVKVDMKLSSLGAKNMAFLVSKQDGGKVFAALKTFSKEFAYWRHFEDQELLLTKVMQPVVRMIPLSSKAYIDYLESGNTTPTKAERRGAELTL